MSSAVLDSRAAFGAAASGVDGQPWSAVYSNPFAEEDDDQPAVMADPTHGSVGGSGVSSGSYGSSSGALGTVAGSLNSGSGGGGGGGKVKDLAKMFESLLSAKKSLSSSAPTSPEPGSVAAPPLRRSAAGSNGEVEPATSAAPTTPALPPQPAPVASATPQQPSPLDADGQQAPLVESATPSTPAAAPSIEPAVQPSPEVAVLEVPELPPLPAVQPAALTDKTDVDRSWLDTPVPEGRLTQLKKTELWWLGQQLSPKVASPSSHAIVEELMGRGLTYGQLPFHFLQLLCSKGGLEDLVEDVRRQLGQALVADDQNPPAQQVAAGAAAAAARAAEVPPASALRRPGASTSTQRAAAPRVLRFAQ